MFCCASTALPVPEDSRVRCSAACRSLASVTARSRRPFAAMAVSKTAAAERSVVRCAIVGLSLFVLRVP